MRFTVKSLCLVSIIGPLCLAQGTEGLIAGRITDAISTQAIGAAQVTCFNPATNSRWSAITDSSGRYALPLLPPGTYHIRVDHDGYQGKEQFEIALGVAGTVEIDFALRPVNDIWEGVLQRTVLLGQGEALLDFYGPDVDPNYWTSFSPNPGKSGKLEASLSDAVSPADISQLPLAGQNIYTILLAQPGVAADNAVTRSLGIAANGQRPSSSNFLLDGAEANFYLVSGPALTIAPEAVQEYRLSTNNFQAEYGGAAGYIANAVTRSGGDAWHGQGFFDLKNTALNANDFQDNLNGIARTPDKEDRLGFFAGGPLWKDRLFSGTSLEYFRSRGQLEPQTFALPAPNFLNSLRCPNQYCQLLHDFPLANSTGLELTDNFTLAQPISVNQWLALQRFDYAMPNAKERFSLRLAVSNLSRPDFIWSPYRDYVSGLTQPVYNLAGSWTAAPRANWTNRLEIAANDERLGWDRADPQVPTMVAAGGNPGSIPLLPGSPAGYGEDNRSRNVEFHDDATLVRGAHILKFGGGGIWRWTRDYLGYGTAGEFTFCNILRFGYTSSNCIVSGIMVPAVQASVALERGVSTPTQPDLHRAYRSAQGFAFAQDTYRVSPRLVLDFGLRWDAFGAPSYDGGVHDWTVQWGMGTSFEGRIEKATLQPPSVSNSSVLDSGNQDIAPRFGFAYDLFPAGHTLLRGGFGLFYDRLFDNLWTNARNNGFVFASDVTVPALDAISAVLPKFAGDNYANDFPNLTAFQPHLRNGYAEDLFLGVQTQPTSASSVELNLAGSLGRRLITSDVLNRNSLSNDNLPAINYLGNQGLSDYYALSLVTRWRGRHGFLQAAYTWSHAIDLQSDPLAGNFFDLNFVDLGPPASASPTAPHGAAFTTPYDSRGDRGNADFDQRQTLVFYSYWEIPGEHRSWRRWRDGWRFSQIAAVRSGFPYSIFTVANDPLAINAYARTSLPASAVIQPRTVNGGKQLFDGSELCNDDSCSVPATSRNQFAGPGLFNLDVSVSRVFRLRWLGEAGSVVARADAFNFLNHANLNPPSNLPGTNYGLALYGRPAASQGFPAVLPLGSTARQIQLAVRVLF